MLHDSTSSSVAGRPNCALSCASATPDVTINAAARRCLRIDMAHLPVRADRPTGDAIGHVVPGEAAFHDHGGARPLHVAGVVSAAALQHRGLAVPAPWHLETHQRLRQHLRLNRGLGPALAAVGGDLDLAHDAAPAAGPGETVDLVETGPLELEFGRGLCDHRLR